MKKIKVFSLIILSAIALTSCKKENEESAKVQVAETTKTETQNDVPAKVETASFTIDGMTCEIGCAKTIESKLSGLEGVEEAKVNFEEKKATVVFDANKQSAESLKSTVEDVAGGDTYTVSDIQVTPKA
ncbi:cation transporter [Flavobacterium sp. NRK F10]|uniref:heavy-metal-associated domain-containing protein n=1 Tax=Flavobacterium sp. NRK F10 TaxID=2954931 RepID=UPI0020915247|nr:heavy metal-associated domain-containing protein [Flavobacterium sp. NRK F10]MCO6174457.1 cation transporter [Flavobacterium sp. NRK F10]